MRRGEYHLDFILMFVLIDAFLLQRAKRNKRKPAVRRASSANDFDFDPMQLSAANRRELFSR